MKTPETIVFTVFFFNFGAIPGTPAPAVRRGARGTVRGGSEPRTIWYKKKVSTSYPAWHICLEHEQVTFSS